MRALRLFVFIFALCLATSCRSPEKTVFRIGVSLCNDDMWHQQLIRELKHAALFYPEIELTIRENSNGDDRSQIENLEEFVSNGMDLIVVSAGNATLISPVVSHIYGSGLPVIVLDQKVETSDYTAYVGGDNYMIGRQAGLLVANRLNGRGNVAEIRGRTESLTDIERHNGFRDALYHYPGISIAVEDKAYFNTRIAEQVTADIIASGKHIDVVFAMDDLTAKGVHNAYAKLCLPKPFTIGVDALSGEGGGIDNIIKGYQDASFIYPTGADKTLEIAVQILHGKPFRKENLLYTGIVDSSNAELFKLQGESINNEQAKSAEVNDRLTRTLDDYSRQRNLLFAAILALIAIGILFGIAINAYRSKSKAQKRLSEQNDKTERQNAEILLQNAEIKQQAEVLQEQKEQLEKLSGELHQAVDAKLAFFTNISHEFKTPLSLIIDPLNSILESGTLSPDDRYRVELACRNSRTMLNLITQIIDFNKYDSHRYELLACRADFAEFITGINSLFGEGCIRKQVGLSFTTDGGDYTFCFDREKMERVFVNLLSNALRHVGKGGSIDVKLGKTVEAGRQYAMVEIFNDGPGIEPTQINSIFDRFYKVDPSSAGSGIGLALASTLVQLHEGKINALNTQTGVCFCVLIPLDLSPANDISDEEPILTDSMIHEDTTEPYEASDSEGNRKETGTVLIVEDNDEIRGYLNFLLRDSFRVIEASDGAEGLEKAKKYLPELVISDVMMPGMDGLEMCRSIKENPSTCHIPVVLLTARAFREHETEGFDNGADLYITKPFDSQLLVLRVRKLIENRRRITEAFRSSLLDGTGRQSVGKAEDDYIERFRTYVIENITDSSLSIETIASAFGESYMGAYRKIKAITGYAPSELIRIIRLKYARELLNRKTDNIATVAYESGFSTPSYFTRCFKEFYKESPTDYLKKIK